MARFVALAAAASSPQSGWCAAVKPLSTVDPADIFSVAAERGEGAIPGPALGGHESPLPTNAWWENIVVAGDTSLPEGNIFQMPYVIMVDNRGLHAMQPFTTGVTTQGFDKVEALSLSAAEFPEGPRASSWDELSVTLHWPMEDPEKGVKVPLVRGSPYITAEYAGVTPQVTSEQQLRPDDEGLFKIRVDGETVDCGGEPFSGKTFLVELVQSDATWAIFSPPDVQWSCTPEPFSLTASDPMEKGAVRAAIANSCTTGTREHHCQDAPEGRDAAAYAGLLEAHAGVYPVNASVEWKVGETDGNVTWKWGKRRLGGHDRAPLLQLAYPVHQPLLAEDARDSVHGEARSSGPFRDLRGRSVPVVGDSWVLTYPLFPDVGLYAPRPVASGLKAEMLQALRGSGGAPGALWNGSMPDCDFDVPLNYRLGVGDTYFSGKMLARLARLVVIADELGESKEPYFTDMVERLTERIEVWLHKDAEAPFVYDATWGGLLSCGCLYDDCEGECEPRCTNQKKPAGSCPALEMPGMNFGNGYYNDHHFHYGYFVYSAAVAAKYAPEWEEEWREQILAIVRDYANPSADDPSFPVARHKDWFLGISWAGGIPQAYENGRNQESTSEAINSYYAVYAYGSAVRAPFASRLRDFGRILTAMESHGADTYWHVRKDTGIYGDDFPDQVIGILWDHVVEHQTWFGGAPYIVSGIQLLPIVPVMENYLDPDWVWADSTSYKEQCEKDPECSNGWSWPLCLEQAVVDPVAAYTCVHSLPNDAFDTNNAAANGNSLTNSLHWIATRPEAADLVFGDGGDSSSPRKKKRNNDKSKKGTDEQTPEQTTKPPKKDDDKRVGKEKEQEDEEEEKETTMERWGQTMRKTPTRTGTSRTSGTYTKTTATTTAVYTRTSPLTTSTAAAIEVQVTETSQVTQRPIEKITTLGAITTTLAPTTTTASATFTATASTTQKTTVPTTTKKNKVVSEDPADEGDGSIQSGDTILLRAHTGSYLDAQGGKVRARWNAQRDLQRMVITKEGGGTIWSEDTVFLRTHAGKSLNVEGDTVEARSDEAGPTQELVVEKEANDGAIWPGDVVFLMAHTGKCVDVQGIEVSARWPIHGPWQAFTIEKANSPEELPIVASEDSEAASEDAIAEAVVFADSQGSDHRRKGTKFAKERNSSVPGALRVGALKRFEARGDGAPAQPARPRAADANRSVAYAGLFSAGGLMLLFIARRRILQSTQGATGYEEAAGLLAPHSTWRRGGRE